MLCKVAIIHRLQGHLPSSVLAAGSKAAFYTVYLIASSVAGSGDNCHHLILELYAQVCAEPSRSYGNKEA